MFSAKIFDMYRLFSTLHADSNVDVNLTGKFQGNFHFVGCCRIIVLTFFLVENENISTSNSVCYSDSHRAPSLSF